MQKITDKQKKDLDLFLSMLFKPEELVWFAYSYNYDSIANGYAKPIGDAMNYWLCNHPKHFYYGAKIGLNPANPFHSYRTYENVMECRNILIECDASIPKESQLALMLNSGLPFSSAVWSGGKSVHFVIALNEPISAEKYKEWHQRICVALADALPADMGTAKPTIYTRLPIGLRMTVLVPATVAKGHTKLFENKIEDLVRRDALTWDSLLSKKEWLNPINGKPTLTTVDADDLHNVVASFVATIDITETTPTEVFTKVESQELLYLGSKVPNEKLERWLYSTASLQKWYRSEQFKKKSRKCGPRFIGGNDLKSELRCLVSKYFQDLNRELTDGQHSVPCPSCRDSNHDRSGTNLSVKFTENKNLVEAYCQRGCDFKDYLGILRERFGETDGQTEQQSEPSTREKIFVWQPK